VKLPRRAPQRQDAGFTVQVLPGPTCPECGREVVYDLTCHTYGQGDKWYACLPCDSAVEYICAGQLDDEPTDCRWRYTHGLNPVNPRAIANEESRPPWLPGERSGDWIMPGVKAIWE
jgi:hypothetical protein